MVGQFRGWRFGLVMGILASKFEHLANKADAHTRANLPIVRSKPPGSQPPQLSLAKQRVTYAYRHIHAN